MFLREDCLILQLLLLLFIQHDCSLNRMNFILLFMLIHCEGRITYKNKHVNSAMKLRHQ